ncbi:TMEM175 family protein [Halegenticoccus tardaugens]|uniref:TMEM175 family protein n=1 Tax=Halegenticoccus tardaugens TaxID=2071624 RepID=UPI00100ADDC1|nr:TMEM175 family protein [Halegenticoccus tardaugens]
MTASDPARSESSRDDPLPSDSSRSESSTDSGDGFDAFDDESLTDAEHRRGVDRLVGFSDGVFAIAITLLVLNIEVPDRLPPGTTAVGFVLGEWPDVVSYVVSFLIIGNYWIIHHRVFQRIDRYDWKLLWLNVVYLLFIAFIPFTTALLGDYTGRFSVGLYAATLAAVGIVFAALWWYAASHEGLTSRRLDREQVRYGVLKSLVPTGVFLLSVGVSFYSARLAMYTWLLLLVSDPFFERLVRPKG